MNSGPIDISSDEEPGRDELEDEDDFDWVSELMDSVDHANDDGSDEVVVIGEVNNKPKAKSSKRTVTDVDDDCVVLDGDPDKPISVVDDSGCGSDDLLVVGEKGQIACRDYPHPRNLCAKFPFRTTPHEKHCDLCHCYVCDSLAPCVHWGTGVSKIDHCHATDKEETWKAQRRDFKSVKSAPLSASKYSMALPKFSQVLPLDIIRLAPKPISQNQVSRPTTIRPCSSASRTMPGIRNPGRVHQSEYILSKNQAHAYSVSKQLLGAHNNVVGRNTSRVVSSPSMFKRVGAVGGSLPMNRTAFGSSQNSSCTSPSQYGRNSTPMAAANGRNPLRSQNVQSSVHQNSSQPMGTFIRNTVPSQPQTYIQPIPPSIYSPNFHQPGIQSQNSSQNISQYGNQSQNSSENICLQDIVGESVTDLGFSDCNHSWVNNSSQSVQQLPFQPPPIQQAPFQPPPIQPPPIQQPPFQQPPIQQPPIQQSPFQQPPVEHLQTQSSNPIYAPSPVKESSNELPNLSGLDSEFESWLLETQPVPAVTNDSVPSHLSLLSPEPTFIDTGMLMFDFETSWNGLTQV